MLVKFQVMNLTFILKLSVDKAVPLYSYIYFLLIFVIIFEFNKMQQYQNQIASKGNVNTQDASQKMKQIFTMYPYQFYPPYWPYPTYNSPDFQRNKYLSSGCRHCRQVTYISVMTQTPENVLESYEINKICNNQIQEIHVTTPKEKELDSIIKDSKNSKQIVNVGSMSVQQAYKKNYSLQCQIASCEDSYSQASQKLLTIQANKKYQNSGSSNYNQQLFAKMLRLYMVNQKEYELMLFDYIKSDTLIAQMVKYFNQKLLTFKKSKEQMIKLIIRKAQRHFKHQHDCKKDERFIKFGGYKSMNSIYLQKIFSDPDFIRSYEIITENFIQDFQRQNQQKLVNFIDKICSSDNYLEFKTSIRYIDQKNKMPWPAYWVQKLRNVSLQLKQTYISEKIIQTGANKMKNKKC